MDLRRIEALTAQRLEVGNQAAVARRALDGQPLAGGGLAKRRVADHALAERPLDPRHVGPAVRAPEQPDQRIDEPGADRTDHRLEPGHP